MSSRCQSTDSPVSPLTRDQWRHRTRIDTTTPFAFARFVSVLSLVALAIVTSLEAQAKADSVPLITPAFDPVHLVTRRDSFQISFQGSLIGNQVTELLVTGDSMVYRDRTTMPVLGMNQETILRLDPTTLIPISVDRVDEMAGQRFETHLVYKDRKIRGSAQVPQPGALPTIVEVDTVLPQNAIDMTTLQALFPALPLEPGASMAFTAFESSGGMTIPMRVEVAGPEEITVPAGTFSVLRVELTGGDMALVMLVDTETPRRIVKSERADRPLVFELVERR